MRLEARERGSLFRLSEKQPLLVARDGVKITNPGGWIWHQKYLGHLTASNRSVLQSMLTELGADNVVIKEVPDATHKHPCARFIRDALENLWLSDKRPTIDVGGNCHRHLKARRHHVHSLEPITCGADRMRYSNRRPRSAAAKYCHHTVGECNCPEWRHAQIVSSIDSCYYCIEGLLLRLFQMDKGVLRILCHVADADGKPGALMCNEATVLV